MEKEQHGFAPVEIATGEILIAHASRYEASAIAAVHAAGIDPDTVEVMPIIFSVSQ